MIEQLVAAPRAVASLGGTVWRLARAAALRLPRPACWASTAVPREDEAPPARASVGEAAVRDYLRALREPESFRDDDRIDTLTDALSRCTDPVERLHLRQQLLDAATPSLERFEEAFIAHAKTWADELGLGTNAFTDQVSPDVLRRAGFT